MLIRIFITTTLLISLISCSSFQAKRLNAEDSDEKSLEITSNWLTKDTEIAVKKILDRMKKHRGLKRYLEFSLPQFQYLL
jgi:hypothetical protein